MTPNAQLHTCFTLGLSAASGLVLRDGVVSVLGDDCAALHRYRLHDGAALPSIPLLGLSADSVLAKAQKPDLEALVDLGDGSLLALGSGSRPNRERGIRINSTGTVELIDLAPLYARLRNDIPDLNIEGAVLHAGALVLAHRGVGHGDASRLIRLDVQAVLDPRRTRWLPDLLREIHSLKLGELDGIALAFTDLACNANGALHYLAAAEVTDDPYLDGECRGSVIGRIESDGRAHTLARLRPDVKAEGLAWLGRSEHYQRWLVVTDADDPTVDASLFELRLPSSKL